MRTISKYILHCYYSFQSKISIYVRRSIKKLFTVCLSGCTNLTSTNVFVISVQCIFVEHFATIGKSRALSCLTVMRSNTIFCNFYDNWTSIHLKHFIFLPHSMHTIPLCKNMKEVSNLAEGGGRDIVVFKPKNCYSKC